jgi:hypothetical protein
MTNCYTLSKYLHTQFNPQMKKLFLLALICTLGFVSTSKASIYKVDDAAIEASFSQAKAVAFDFNQTGTMLNPMGGQVVKAEKQAIVAILLDFFLGGIAIHRVYLGGKPILVLGYLVTCGGIFGIVPLVDLIVLAINYDDISQYVGNSRFFMW